MIGPAVITEKRWQAQVVALLRHAGWWTYHTFDSRRSDPGFPDIVAIRDNRMLAIELKTVRGKPTSEQLAWLDALRGVKVVDAFVLRPANDLSEFTALIERETP